MTDRVVSIVDSIITGLCFFYDLHNFDYFDILRLIILILPPTVLDTYERQI